MESDCKSVFKYFSTPFSCLTPSCPLAPLGTCTSSVNFDIIRDRVIAAENATAAINTPLHDLRKERKRSFTVFGSCLRLLTFVFLAPRALTISVTWSSSPSSSPSSSSSSRRRMSLPVSLCDRAVLSLLYLASITHDLVPLLF